ncbi:phage tail protein [Mucilaginibacter paludis]|uniref:Tail Collar domain protein n=1 Tax=Mucilaginibacter paludis DSM 18603 TaxID=714943 RepID=H1Y2C1_9SPHI|nr:tail fiber protein [Mucilaginibacter paludis]EHQ27901.1 Tail Collar domain protein [Mucilaginibacter paludis DSM 18603]
MTDNFLGEIRLFSCNFAPDGWALCNGAILQIQQNTALYSLLGKSFGGDGIKTFGLPDLRSRTPICTGQSSATTTNYTMGLAGGVETVTLTAPQMPAHNHYFAVYNGQGLVNEPNDILAIPHSSASPSVQINTYNSNATTQTTLNTESIVNVGGSEAHNNVQPFLTLNFCIAIQGIYPPRP